MSDKNPCVAEKWQLLDTYAAEAVAAGAHNGASVEIPRGAKRIRFKLDGTLFDRTTGDETYTFKIQTRPSSAHSWADVPSGGFTTVAATTGYEIIPTAATAPGVVIARWVRVVLTSAGTTPIATAKIFAIYELAGGAGKQYAPGYLGG